MVVAKKRDLTKAQRRELAKRRRFEEVQRKIRRRRVRRIRTTAVAVILVGGIAALVFWNQQRGRQAVAGLDELVAAAGCTALQRPPDLGRAHLQPGETFDYNSNPPTSGKHSGQTGPTGIPRQPIPSENQVHNLEHGHVGIQYKDLPDPLVRELEMVTRENPTLIFMAPRPELEAKLALSAWGRFIACTDPTERAVELARQFVKQFAGKGPEGAIPGNPIGV